MAKKIEKEAKFQFTNQVIIKRSDLKDKFSIFDRNHSHLSDEYVDKICYEWSVILRNLGSELARRPTDIIDFTQSESQSRKIETENEKKKNKLEAGYEVIAKSINLGKKKKTLLIVGPILKVVIIIIIFY
jgi:hypothetical protein